MHNDDEIIINDDLVSEIGEEQLTSGQSFFQQGGFKNSAFRVWNPDDYSKWFYGDELEDIPLLFKEIAQMSLPFVEFIPPEWSTDFVERAALWALYKLDNASELTVEDQTITISDKGVLKISF